MSPRRRTQMGAAVMLMLASSMAEVVSLTSIVPFLAVLTNSDALWNQPLVQHLAPYLGITHAYELLIPITLGFAAAAVGSAALRLLTLWVNGRLAAAIGSDLSCEVYRRTLYQPYAVHITRNSSALIASISGDVGRVIGQVLNPLLQLLSSALISLALVCTLLTIDWFVALGAGLLIGLVYSAAIAQSSRPLQKLGLEHVLLERQLIQSLQEGLGAIRDVLIDGSQTFYATTYRQADQLLRRSQAQSSFLQSYPRLVMEPVGIALLSVIGCWLALQGSVTKALPLLGLLALGAQRLLPMAQKVYEGWALSRNAKNSLANVLALLAQPLPALVFLKTAKPLELRENILLDRVSFRYEPELSEVLHIINLEIRRGDRIGLIGSTGSGKSTLLDLLIGLLTPTNGRVLVDGIDIQDPLYPELPKTWRAAIAHVPQSVYLADSSVAENIAFGIPKDAIDLERVRMAAEQAQIASFIDSCSQGYNTFVGERGIRLSGGQRQRIGIARALYKQAKILVLDEATAALDTVTEQAVMQEIATLSRELTIVMIAHRLTTVANCDRIIRLHQGRIIAEGPPALLLPKV